MRVVQLLTPPVSATGVESAVDALRSLSLHSLPRCWRCNGDPSDAADCSCVSAQCPAFPPVADTAEAVMSDPAPSQAAAVCCLLWHGYLVCEVASVMDMCKHVGCVYATTVLSRAVFPNRTRCVVDVLSSMTCACLRFAFIPCGTLTPRRLSSLLLAGVLQRLMTTQWFDKQRSSPLLQALFDLRTPDTVWLQTELLHAWIGCTVDLHGLLKGPCSSDAVLQSLTSSLTWLWRLDAKHFKAAEPPRCASLLFSVWESVMSAAPVPPPQLPADPDTVVTAMASRYVYWMKLSAAVNSALTPCLPGRWPDCPPCAAVWRRSDVANTGKRLGAMVFSSMNDAAFLRQEAAKVRVLYLRFVTCLAKLGACVRVLSPGVCGLCGVHPAELVACQHPCDAAWKCKGRSRCSGTNHTVSLSAQGLSF